MSFDFSAMMASVPFIVFVVLLAQLLAETLIPFASAKCRPLLWRWAERAVLILAGLLNNGGKGAVTQLLRGTLLLLMLLAGGFVLGGVLSFVTALLLFVQSLLLFVCFYICLGFLRPYKIHAHILKLVGEIPPERAEIVGLFANLGIPVPRISKPMSPYIKAGVMSAGYYMNILLTGPLFWFWLAGLYGMFSYVLVMTAVIVLPHRDDSLFSLPVCLAARLMDLLPGLMTAVLLYPVAVLAFRAPPAVALADLRQDPMPLLTNGLLAVTAVMAAAAGTILGETVPHWYLGAKAAETVLGEEAAEAEGLAKPESLQAARRFSAFFCGAAMMAALAFSIKFAL